MATGDLAAAAGIPVVPSTADVRNGYDNINQIADAIGSHILNGGHATSKITGLDTALAGKAANPPIGGRAVGDVTGSNVIGLRWNGAAPVVKVDVSEFQLSVSGHGHNASEITIDGYNLRDVVNGKANVGAPVAYADKAGGSNGPHTYSVSGGGPYYAVWVDGAGNFGRNTSSRRYKTEIKDHGFDPADVLQLQPVTFRRKGNKDNWQEVGLIAEDVAELVPELVDFDRDEDGQMRPEAVRYDLLSLALLDVCKDLAARLAALEAPEAV